MASPTVDRTGPARLLATGSPLPIEFPRASALDDHDFSRCPGGISLTLETPGRMPTPAELWTRYINLSDDGKLLVQLACLHECARAKELLDLFLVHSYRHDRFPLGPADLLKLLNKLELLRPDGSGVNGPLEIREDVCAHAVSQGTMPELLKLTGHLSTRFAKDSFQEARRRLYSGEKDVLAAYPAGEMVSHLRRLVKGLTRPESLVLFDLNHAIAVSLLRMSLSFVEGHDCGVFLDYLEGLSNVTLAEFVQEEVQLFRLLRGEKINKALPRVEAVRDLFEGKLPEDPRILELNPDQCGFWDFLAVAAGYEPHSEELTLAATLLNGLLHGDTDYLLDQGVRHLSYAPSDEAFGMLVTLLWAGKIKSVPPTLFEHHIARLHASGLRLLASEMEALHASQSRTSSKLTPFLSLREPVPRWRQVLEQLERVGLAMEMEEVPTARLVWVVNPVLVREPLSCRVQTIGARGDWTPGKKIKLNDLGDYEGCMDEYDRKVWDGHREFFQQLWSYRTPNPRSLYPALVGHPRLLMYKAEHRRVEFIKGVPSVRTEVKGDQIELTLCPFIPRDQKVVAEPAGEGVYQIFEADQTYRSLQFVLGEETKVDVPVGEKERVARSLQTLVGESLKWEGDQPMDLGTRQITGDSTPVVRLWPLRRGLEGCALIRPFAGSNRSFTPGHGPAFYTETVEGQEVLVKRDLGAERVAFEKIKELLDNRKFKDGHFTLPLPEMCLDFLSALSSLPEGSYRLEWPRGAVYRIHARLGLESLRMRLRSDASWFALEGSVRLSDGQRVELLKMLETARGLRDFVPLDDGSYVQLTRALRSTLQALEAANISRRDGELLLHRTSCALLAGMREIQADAESSSYLQEIKEVMEREYDLPTNFNAHLRSYQMEGYRWLRRAADLGWGVCLADDMGLGKTVQTLALLATRTDGPNLVVAPTSVASNWKAEAEKFAPGITTHLFSEVADRAELLKNLKPGEVLIASYGLLVNEADKLGEVSWSAVVLDEAQAIKNYNTKRSKAARALDAGFRLATTGTPVENHADELWSLFQFLNPGFLGSKKLFDKRITAEGGREAVSKLVRPFLLRRLKADVLADLPPRVDCVLWVELSDEEKLFYEGLRLQAVTRLTGKQDDLFSVLSELTRLRRACCHPKLLDKKSKIRASKLTLLRRLLQSLREGGHAALVFSQFVDHLSLAREMLEAEGITYLYLDGKTPAGKRKSLVDSFQNGEADLFLISLKAGGTGLNLTRANYVFHLDPWWNPAVEDQASDRAHRIGQKQSVTVYRLIAKDTIEQKILALHAEKRDLADQILEGTDRSAKLDPEVLVGLLGESSGALRA